MEEFGGSRLRRMNLDRQIHAETVGARWLQAENVDALWLQARMKLARRHQAGKEGLVGYRLDRGT